LQVLHRLRVARPETAVVVISGQGTIDAAVEAMKAGAVDFVEKPFEVDALRRTLQTVQEEQRARTLLGVPAAEGAIARVLSDAATRKVLLDPSDVRLNRGVQLGQLVRRKDVRRMDLFVDPQNESRPGRRLGAR